MARTVFKDLDTIYKHLLIKQYPFEKFRYVLLSEVSRLWRFLCFFNFIHKFYSNTGSSISSLVTSFSLLLNSLPIILTGRLAKRAAALFTTVTPSFDFG